MPAAASAMPHAIVTKSKFPACTRVMITFASVATKP